MMNNIKAAKAMAKHLTEALVAAGQTLPHSNALEVVAKAYGARTWHAFLSEQSSKQGAAKATPLTTVPEEAPKEWNPSEGPMSDAQFVAAEGGRCPACNGDSVECNHSQFEGALAFQSTRCLECDAEWSEVYTLTSYSDFVPPQQSTAGKDDNLAFFEKVRDWMSSELNGEEEYRLDDWVIEDHVADVMSEVNQAADSDEQDRLISEAESDASDVNNQGILNQLAYLYTSYDDHNGFNRYADFAKAVAAQLNIDIKRLAM